MNSNLSIVDEVDYGVWVWELPDGRILGNADGDVLNVPGYRNDLAGMTKIKRAAAHYGYPDGKPKFLQGHRRISQSEWEDQMARAIAGEEFPDPLDPGIVDELNNKYGKR